MLYKRIVIKTPKLQTKIFYVPILHLNIQKLESIFLGSKRAEKKYWKEIDELALTTKVISNYKKGREW